MTAGFLDISQVTHEFVAMMQKSIDSSPFWQNHPRFNITVTGNAAEIKNSNDGCLLIARLISIKPIVTKDSNITTYLEELNYLVFTKSGKNYVKEQKALSLGFQAIRDNPVLPIDQGPFRVVFSQISLDELSTIWQSISKPMKASFVCAIVR